MGITITPVDDGRFEVILDGHTLFDRKAEGGIYPGLDRIRAMKRTVRERLEKVVAVAS